MEQIKIDNSAAYSLAVHSEKTLNVSLTIQHKYVSNYFIFEALRQKIQKDQPDFLNSMGQQTALREQLYQLLDTAKNSGLEAFPQVLLLSLAQA